MNLLSLLLLLLLLQIVSLLLLLLLLLCVFLFPLSFPLNLLWPYTVENYISGRMIEIGEEIDNLYIMLKPAIK